MRTIQEVDRVAREATKCYIDHLVSRKTLPIKKRKRQVEPERWTPAFFKCVDALLHKLDTTPSEALASCIHIHVSCAQDNGYLANDFLVAVGEGLVEGFVEDTEYPLVLTNLYEESVDKLASCALAKRGETLPKRRKKKRKRSRSAPRLHHQFVDGQT